MKRLHVFSERLKQIVEEGNYTITGFANLTKLSRQTIGFYLAGDRLPDAEGLMKICMACKVSADWLIGLSDTRTVEPDARTAVEYTGLSPEAVEALHEPESIFPDTSCKGFHNLQKAVLSNMITCREELRTVINHISLAKDAKRISRNYPSEKENFDLEYNGVDVDYYLAISNELESRGRVEMRGEDAFDLLKAGAAFEFSKLVDRLLNEEE